MYLLKTYIGKLLGVYAITLCVILMISVPIIKYSYDKEKLELETYSEPQCDECIYNETLKSSGAHGLISQLNTRQARLKFDYLLFSMGAAKHYGNLFLSEDDIQTAMQEHFAFTDIPYHLEHNIATDTVISLLQLDDGYFLALEDKLSSMPASAPLLISMLNDKISKNALVNAITISFLSITGFLATLIMALKIHNKIKGITDTFAAIVENMDLTKRIPSGANENEFNQLAGQFNSMLYAIESKMNDVTAMSNMLAHELKTPLSRLKHQLLEKTEKDPSSYHLHESLDSVIRTFDTALRICRLEGGHANLSLQNSNICTIVDDAVDLLRPLAEEKKQQINTNIQCERFIFDPGLISQVLVNLIDNAIKYSGDHSTISIGVKLVSGNCEISVQDSGTGISDDILPQVTGLYVKGPNNKESKGVGLGLHMVNAIARAHQGSLTCSNLPNGFVVTILLPAK